MAENQTPQETPAQSKESPIWLDTLIDNPAMDAATMSRHRTELDEIEGAPFARVLHICGKAGEIEKISGVRRPASGASARTLEWRGAVRFYSMYAEDWI